jgi:hypothetical protein
MRECIAWLLIYLLRKMKVSVILNYEITYTTYNHFPHPLKDTVFCYDSSFKYATCECENQLV